MRRITVVLGLVACGGPSEIAEADYAESFARAMCDRLHECARGTFDTTYFSLSDCHDQLEQQFGDQVQAQDDIGCDYDAEKAATAYSDMLDGSCEDFYKGRYLPAATNIWSCDILVEDEHGGHGPG